MTYLCKVIYTSCHRNLDIIFLTIIRSILYKIKSATISRGIEGLRVADWSVVVPVQEQERKREDANPEYDPNSHACVVFHGLKRKERSDRPFISLEKWLYLQSGSRKF